MAGRYRLLVCFIVGLVCLLAIALVRYRSNGSSTLVSIKQVQSLEPASVPEPLPTNTSIPEQHHRPSSPRRRPPLVNTAATPTVAEVRRDQHLTWTSLQDGADQDTTFFSAHYERRKGSPYTPGIIVMGYHMKKLKDLKLYCKLTYSNEVTKCITEPLEQINLCTGGLDGDKIATSHMYVCRLKCHRSECTEDEIPLTVAISKNTDCTDASAEIPVVNRQPPDESEKKMFGVCVQSPVYGSTRLQDIVEFIEMNRALGVEIVTLYVMDMDKETWQFLEDHYVKQGHLRLLRWKKVEKWIPLHYFGQPLLMQDCLHRNMHRAKYLLLIDLDELLLPKKHKTLLDLVDSFGHHDSYHSYVFGNCFYTKNEAEEKPTLPCKKTDHVPKYFEKTSRISCYCHDGAFYRQKFMIQTELVLDLYIHWACWSISGKELKLSYSDGVNAHYRDQLPGDCADRSKTHDTTALLHQSTVMQAMQQQMCTEP